MLLRKYQAIVPESIALWAVTDAHLSRLSSTPIDRERKLEDWIQASPEVLGEPLLIIGRQVRTSYGGILDLLAVDVEGRCVVIELKRGRTARDIVGQTIDYVSWVAELSDAQIRDMATVNTGVPFNDAFRNRFSRAGLPNEVNSEQRVLIVATDVDDSTIRIVNHLTKRYGIDINVVAFSHFTLENHELLARTWVVEPAELEERIDSRVALNNDEPAPPGLWHINVGVFATEVIRRNWDDPRAYGFLSAGQGTKWRDKISRLSVGDHVYAYLNGAGYVGGGTVVSTATRADQFISPIHDKPLRELPLKSQAWFTNESDPEAAEYMIGVKWDKTVPAVDALRVPHPLRGTVNRIRSADLAATLRAAFG